MKLLIAIFILVSIATDSIAQYKNLNVKFGKYTFLTKFDTSNYLTTLKIRKGKNTIYYKISEFPITGITQYDLNNDGVEEILLDLYSGGAHCCTYLCAARIEDDKFKIMDTIFWGNSFYKIEDVDNNGKKEIIGVNDMFAYTFTNYAQSEFQVLIYAFENNKFIEVTPKFPKIIEKDIENHRDELKPYLTDSSFACPQSIDEDTFNTDAGAVKAILAPIVADYYSLNEVHKGYALVDSIYKCMDKNKFIDTLKNVYKLK